MERAKLTYLPLSKLTTYKLSDQACEMSRTAALGQNKLLRRPALSTQISIIFLNWKCQSKR